MGRFVRDTLRVVVYVALWLGGAAALAQDNNHATETFGSRSSLFGGAVVGGTRDTSAVYYNPGALGFVENSELSVSANAYRFSTIALKNGAGTGDDLSASPFSQVPTLVSALVRLDESDPTHTLGYAVLARRAYDTAYSARTTATLNVISDLRQPGNEEYIGQYAATTKLSELWAGGTYAWRGSSHFAIGLTTFFIYRTQSFAENVVARAVNPGTLNVSATTFAGAYDYTSVSVLWKLGLALDFEPVRLGITATSPNLRLLGTGTVSADLTVNDVDLDGDPSTGESITGNDRQDELASTLKNPPSLAFGIEVDLDEVRVAATVEWFAGIGQYQALQPASRSFTLPAGVFPLDSADMLRLLAGYEAVVNFAVAVEYVFTPTFSAVVSFRSDFTAALAPSNADGIEVGESFVDLWHATIGIMNRGEESALALGVVVSFGRTDAQQVVNFSNPDEDSLLVGTSGDVPLTYFAVGVLLGYTYYF